MNDSNLAKNIEGLPRNKWFPYSRALLLYLSKAMPSPPVARYNNVKLTTSSRSMQTGIPRPPFPASTSDASCTTTTATPMLLTVCSTVIRVLTPRNRPRQRRRSWLLQLLATYIVLIPYVMARPLYLKYLKMTNLAAIPTMAAAMRTAANAAHRWLFKREKTG